MKALISLFAFVFLSGCAGLGTKEPSPNYCEKTYSPAAKFDWVIKSTVAPDGAGLQETVTGFTCVQAVAAREECPLGMHPSPTGKGGSVCRSDLRPLKNLCEDKELLHHWNDRVLYSEVCE